MKTTMTWQEYADKTDRVRGYARRCDYEREHSEQTTRLALCLFDCLKDRLSLDLEDRFLLECGAILHDIGWQQGPSKHHKTAMEMILNDTSMPLGPQERVAVALIARYHRKALPKASHRGYQDLSPPARHKVSLLAGMLRLADGLDRSHMNAVQDLVVEWANGLLHVICRTRGPVLAEIAAAAKKSDLIEKVLGIKVEISQEEA